MPKVKRYSVRSFCYGRWEVFDTRDGSCQSFGMSKRDATVTARAMNSEVYGEDKQNV